MARPSRTFVLGCLVLLALAHLSVSDSATPGDNVIEEELTEDQIAYYREIFQQYDENADQKISMEENLAQDKIIADEQQKPFDEVVPRPTSLDACPALCPLTKQTNAALTMWGGSCV